MPAREGEVGACGPWPACSRPSDGTSQDARAPPAKASGVCDFIEVLGVTQSKASRHLRYMVNAGLLEDRREAVWVHYRLAERPGPLQTAILADLKRTLPRQVPKVLVAALAAWRKRKSRKGAACKPSAVPGRPKGARR